MSNAAVPVYRDDAGLPLRQRRAAATAALAARLRAHGMSLSAVALRCRCSRRHAARLARGTPKGPPRRPPFETHGEWWERMADVHGRIPRALPQDSYRPTVDLLVERDYLRRRRCRGERRQRERDRRAREAVAWLDQRADLAASAGVCMSVRAAACNLGVSERTLHRWLTAVPGARGRVDERRHHARRQRERQRLIASAAAWLDRREARRARAVSPGLASRSEAA